MLSQTKFYKKYKEEIVWGLVFGFLAGFVWGLVFGLVGLVLGLLADFVWGLVFGLLVGLVFGLLDGFVLGLVAYLVSSLVLSLIVILLNFKEALPFLCNFPEWLFLIIGIIIISESMFMLMPKEKLNKKVNVFWHTCKRKLENIFEVLMGLTFISIIYISLREIKVSFGEVLKYVGYIGVGIIGLGLIVLIFYGWIKLNSLKYKR